MTATTPPVDRRTQTVQKEVVASKTFETSEEGNILRYPIHDNGDYDGRIIFNVIKEEDIDVAGLLGDFGETLFAAISRTEKVDDRGEVKPTTAKGQIEKRTEENLARAQLKAPNEKSVKKGVPKFNILESCELYLPAGIQISDGVQYDNAQLGRVGMGVARGLSAGEGAVPAATKAMVDGVRSFADSFTGNATTPLAKLGVTAAARKYGSDEVGNAVRSVTKVTLNPNTRALFEGVNIRSFNFTFTMLPQSSIEAEQIKKIVKFFRTYLYPKKIPLSAGNDAQDGLSLGYEFPNRFQIKLLYRNSEVATRLLPCYLENFSTTYNPQTMAMHRDGNFQQVDITLGFTETRTLSQEDIERGY